MVAVAGQINLITAPNRNYEFSKITVIYWISFYIVQ